MDEKEIELLLPEFTPNEHPEENIVILKHGKTYFEIHGEKNTGPWIVCLHGIGWWSFCYHFVIKGFVDEGYRVLVFDFYGRGNSAFPSIVFTPQLLVEQTLELMEKLEIKEPVVLMGASMGGLVATHLTVKYPERVSHLILLAPAITPTPLPFLARLITLPGIGTALFSLAGRASLLDKLRKERFANDFVNAKDHTQLIEQLFQRIEWQLLNTEFHWVMHSTLCNFPLSSGSAEEIKQLGRLDVPVLLCWGEFDQVCPYENHKMVLADAPQTEFVSIPNVGHSIFFEAPKTINSATLSFLNKHKK